MSHVTFCKHCNIEHPPINGLLSYEIVRESTKYQYRNLTFEIWIIENPNSHWWAWGIPTGKTKECIDELARLEHLFSFSEGYYMPGYIYREDFLKTKELALQDAKESLKGISDGILDGIVPAVEKKLKRLKEVLKEMKEG